MTRRINDVGLDLIKSFETLQTTGYLPTVNDKPTAGWGHTGPDVEVGVDYPLTQCVRWLLNDLAWAEDAVDSATTGITLTDNQFAALVSLTFNIGKANFDHSTVLRDLQAQDDPDAAKAFELWNKQAGEVLNGLTRRRAAEEALFNTPDGVNG